MLKPPERAAASQSNVEQEQCSTVGLAGRWLWLWLAAMSCIALPPTAAEAWEACITAPHVVMTHCTMPPCVTSRLEASWSVRWRNHNTDEGRKAFVLKSTPPVELLVSWLPSCFVLPSTAAQV